MPKIVRRCERGFVDPLSLFGLLFLVITLGAITYVTANRGFSLNIAEKAGVDYSITEQKTTTTSNNNCDQCLQHATNASACVSICNNAALAEPNVPPPPPPAASTPNPNPGTQVPPPGTGPKPGEFGYVYPNGDIAGTYVYNGKRYLVATSGTAEAAFNYYKSNPDKIVSANYSDSVKKDLQLDAILAASQIPTQTTTAPATNTSSHSPYECTSGHGGTYNAVSGTCTTTSTSQTVEKTDEGFITHSTTFVRDVYTGKIIDAKTTSYIPKTTTTTSEIQGNTVTTSLTSYINPDTGNYYTDEKGKAIINITGLSVLPPSLKKPGGTSCSDSSECGSGTCGYSGGSRAGATKTCQGNAPVAPPPLSDKRSVGQNCTDSSECGSGSCGYTPGGRSQASKSCQREVLPDNNYGSCNGDPTCNSVLTSIDRGMNAISFGGWSNYVNAYSPDKVKYTWDELGYDSVKECQDDMIAKNGNPQAASSCNTYQITKEQAIASIQLGTTLTAEAAAIIALPGAIAAGGTAITAGATTLQVGGAVLAPALTSFGAISTLQQTAAAAVAQIEDPGSEEAWKQTGYAALSWLNIASADKLVKSFQALEVAGATSQTISAANSARNINNAVTGLNVIADSYGAIDTCSQAGVLTGSCGGALAALGADVVFGTLDYKQGQLGFGDPFKAAQLPQTPDIKVPDINDTRFINANELSQLDILSKNPISSFPDVVDINGTKFASPEQLNLVDQIANNSIAYVPTVTNNGPEIKLPDRPASQDPNTNFNLTKADPNEESAIAAFVSTDLTVQGGAVDQLLPSGVNSQIPNTPPRADSNLANAPNADLTAPKPEIPNSNVTNDVTKPLSNTVTNPTTGATTPTIASFVDESIVKPVNNFVNDLISPPSKPVGTLLANGSENLPDLPWREPEGITTIKTSKIEAINSQLATETGGGGLSVEDIRKLIKEDQFDWAESNRTDPIVAYEMPDGSYRIETGRHRAEALVLEGVPDIQVKLYTLADQAKIKDTPLGNALGQTKNIIENMPDTGGAITIIKKANKIQDDLNEFYNSLRDDFVPEKPTTTAEVPTTKTGDASTDTTNQVAVVEPKPNDTAPAAKPLSERLFGEPKTISSANLNQGDTIKLFPGDRVDGVITTGASRVPELRDDQKYYWSTSDDPTVHELTAEGITVKLDSGTSTVYISTNPESLSGLNPPYEITITTKGDVPVTITRANPEPGLLSTAGITKAWDDYVTKPLGDFLFGNPLPNTLDTGNLTATTRGSIDDIPFSSRPEPAPELVAKISETTHPVIMDDLVEYSRNNGGATDGMNSEYDGRMWSVDYNKKSKGFEEFIAAGGNADGLVRKIDSKVRENNEGFLFSAKERGPERDHISYPDLTSGRSTSLNNMTTFLDSDARIVISQSLAEVGIIRAPEDIVLSDYFWVSVGPETKIKVKKIGNALAQEVDRPIEGALLSYIGDRVPPAKTGGDYYNILEYRENGTPDVSYFYEPKKTTLTANVLKKGDDVLNGPIEPKYTRRTTPTADEVDALASTVNFDTSLTSKDIAKLVGPERGAKIGLEPVDVSLADTPFVQVKTEVGDGKIEIPLGQKIDQVAADATGFSLVTTEAQTRFGNNSPEVTGIQELRNRYFAQIGDGAANNNGRTVRFAGDGAEIVFLEGVTPKALRELLDLNEAFKKNIRNALDGLEGYTDAERAAAKFIEENFKDQFFVKVAGISSDATLTVHESNGAGYKPIEINTKVNADDFLKFSKKYKYSNGVDSAVMSVSPELLAKFTPKELKNNGLYVINDPEYGTFLGRLEDKPSFLDSVINGIKKFFSPAPGAPKVPGPEIPKVEIPAEIETIVNRADKALADAGQPNGVGCREGLCETTSRYVQADAQSKGFDAIDYNTATINYARGVDPSDSFYHEFTVITDKNGNKFIADLTLGQFNDIDFNNPVAKTLLEKGVIPLTQENLNQYLNLTTKGNHPEVTLDIFNKVNGDLSNQEIGDIQKYIDGEGMVIESGGSKPAVGSDLEKYVRSIERLVAKGYTQEEAVNLLTGHPFSESTNIANNVPPAKINTPVPHPPSKPKPTIFGYEYNGFKNEDDTFTLWPFNKVPVVETQKSVVLDDLNNTNSEPWPRKENVPIPETGNYYLSRDLTSGALTPDLQPLKSHITDAADLINEGRYDEALSLLGNRTLAKDLGVEIRLGKIVDLGNVNPRMSDEEFKFASDSIARPASHNLGSITIPAVSGNIPELLKRENAIVLLEEWIHELQDRNALVHGIDVKSLLSNYDIEKEAALILNDLDIPLSEPYISRYQRTDLNIEGQNLNSLENIKIKAPETPVVPPSPPSPVKPTIFGYEYNGFKKEDGTFTLWPLEKVKDPTSLDITKQSEPEIKVTDTDLLAIKVTGLSVEDPQIVIKMTEDITNVRAKYNLPRAELKTTNPEGYIAQINLMAKESGVDVKPISEIQPYLEKLGQPFTTAVFMDPIEDAAAGIKKPTIFIRPDAKPSDFEHEFIHSQQYLSNDKSPIEVKEYEAYIADKTPEQLSRDSYANNFFAVQVAPSSLKNYEGLGKEDPDWYRIPTPPQPKPTIFGYEYNGFKNEDGSFTLWPFEKVPVPGTKIPIEVSTTKTASNLPDIPESKTKFIDTPWQSINRTESEILASNTKIPGKVVDLPQSSPETGLSTAILFNKPTEGNIIVYRGIGDSSTIFDQTSSIIRGDPNNLALIESVNAFADKPSPETFNSMKAKITDPQQIKDFEQYEQYINAELKRGLSYDEAVARVHMNMTALVSNPGSFSPYLSGSTDIREAIGYLKTNDSGVIILSVPENRIVRYDNFEGGYQEIGIKGVINPNEVVAFIPTSSDFPYSVNRPTNIENAATYVEDLLTAPMVTPPQQPKPTIFGYEYNGFKKEDGSFTLWPFEKVETPISELKVSDTLLSEPLSSGVVTSQPEEPYLEIAPPPQAKTWLNDLPKPEITGDPIGGMNSGVILEKYISRWDGKWDPNTSELTLTPKTTPNVVENNGIFYDKTLATLENGQIKPIKDGGYKVIPETPGLKNVVGNIPVSDVPREFDGERLAFRGVNYEGMQAALESGVVSSGPKVNNGGQGDKLFFATYPESAFDYGRSGEAYFGKATFDKPSYVFATRWPDDLPIYRDGEIVFNKPIPLDGGIVRIYEIRPYVMETGYMRLTEGSDYMHLPGLIELVDGVPQAKYVYHEMSLAEVENAFGIKKPTETVSDVTISETTNVANNNVQPSEITAVTATKPSFLGLEWKGVRDENGKLQFPIGFNGFINADKIRSFFQSLNPENNINPNFIKPEDVKLTRPNENYLTKYSGEVVPANNATTADINKLKQFQDAEVEKGKANVPESNWKDINNLIENTKGPAIELGGPSLKGFRSININELEKPLIVTNIHSGLPFWDDMTGKFLGYGGKIDKIVDATNLQMEPNSVGTFIGQAMETDVIQKFLPKAYEVLEPGGVLILDKTKISVVADAESVGFKIVNQSTNELGTVNLTLQKPPITTLPTTNLNSIGNSENPINVTNEFEALDKVANEAPPTVIVSNAEEQIIVQDWLSKPRTQDFLKEVQQNDRQTVGIVYKVITTESGQIQVSYIDELGMNMGFVYDPESPHFKNAPDGFQVGDIIQNKFSSGLLMEDVRPLKLNPEEEQAVIEKVLERNGAEPTSEQTVVSPRGVIVEDSGTIFSNSQSQINPSTVPTQTKSSALIEISKGDGTGGNPKLTTKNGDQVEIKTWLAQGGMGTVFKGEYQGNPVVVKVARYSESEKYIAQEFDYINNIRNALTDAGRPDLLPRIINPQVALVDSNGRTIGYAMNELTNVDLDSLIKDGVQGLSSQDIIDFKDIAKILDDSGLPFGDLYPKNIAKDANGTWVLYDPISPNAIATNNAIYRQLTGPNERDLPSHIVNKGENTKFYDDIGWLYEVPVGNVDALDTMLTTFNLKPNDATFPWASVYLNRSIEDFIQKPTVKKTVSSPVVIMGALTGAVGITYAYDKVAEYFGFDLISNQTFSNIWNGFMGIFTRTKSNTETSTTAETTETAATQPASDPKVTDNSPEIVINTVQTNDLPLDKQIGQIQATTFGSNITNPQFVVSGNDNPYSTIPDWFYTDIIPNLDLNCSSKADCLAKFQALPLADGNGDLQFTLNEDYAPSSLVDMLAYDIPVATANNEISQEAAPLVKNLIDDLNGEGTQVTVAYGYRSYSDQANVRTDVGRGAALPGQSLHQGGIAIDINYTRSNGVINANKPLNNNSRITELLHQNGFVQPFPRTDPGHVIALDAIQPGLVQALIDAGINPDDDQVVESVLLGLAQVYEFQASEAE